MQRWSQESEQEKGAGWARSEGAILNIGVTGRRKGVGDSDSADGEDTAGDWTLGLKTSSNHHPSTFK